VTTLSPRGLPLDWRVKLVFAQANYFEGGTPLYALRPAKYVTDDRGGGGLAHSWMLPAPAVERLRRGAPRLELDYSLTLLKPRAHRLRTDGRWHSLPALGACRATPREDDRIAVECFGGFSRPAQLSAELTDIPASRVYGAVDFTPAWARWPYSSREKLILESSRLAPSGEITVTAWEVAGYRDETFVAPGLLGAALDACPLPESDANRAPKARWRDAAPHESNSIGVGDGVQLEVLDFGGAGSPIVLLPGLGATAHAWDEIAPTLAKKHRVVAITRRGAGYSSRPDFGFDTPRLARDVLAVMDAMKIPKALLVGHSIAGDELTWLGGQHADRFSGLVYLDAAYDRSGDDDARHTRQRELGRRLPPEPPIPASAFFDYEQMSRHLAERGHNRYPEGELIAFLNVDKPYLAGTPNIDARTQQAIKAAIRAPEYAALGIPALAVYAFEDPAKPPPPWYDTDAAAIHRELRALGEAMKRENMEVFRRDVAKGRVVELPNASHYLLQSNPREVIDAIEEFSASLTSPASSAASSPASAGAARAAEPPRRY
jgi:non-heme chloroperoxidase